MIQYVITGYGEAAEVFTELTSTPTALKAKQLRVKIKAFAINPYEVAMRQGGMQEVRPITFPYCLGSDAAGVVVEIGTEVTNVNVGDEVVVHAGHGVYADEVVVYQTKVARKPNDISFEKAASLVTPGLSAMYFVEDFLPLKTPKNILIQGASGAVGSLLTQLYVNRGHNVYATASAHNRALVESFGVQQFIAYDEASVAEQLTNQMDVVIDATKGSRTFTSGILCLKRQGTYVALNDLPAKNRRVKNAKYLQFINKKAYTDAEGLKRLLRLAEQEKLSLVIAKKAPPTLNAVISAHEALEGHPPAGKIIIGE